MAKFWHYIPDDPIKVFGAYSASVSSGNIDGPGSAFSHLTLFESGRPTGTVILLYGSYDTYTFIMLDTDWFEFYPSANGFDGAIFDIHPTHSNHASATLGGTKRNVIVLPAYAVFEYNITPIETWNHGYGAPLNGTLYTVPKGDLGIINYTGATLIEKSLRSTSTGGIYLDNFSLQGVNEIQENAFLNENITTNRDVTITNMAEIPAWHSRWNIINSNTNSYYRVKLTKMLHGDNPVFGAIVNGQPVTEIRNGSATVYKKYFGDSVPPTATYIRGTNTTFWTVNSPPDDLFGSFSKTYWSRSGVTPVSMSSWSNSTTVDNSIILAITVSQWENHYLETYVQNPTPSLSSKSIKASRPRATNPLTLSIDNITSTGARLRITNNSEYATLGNTIIINQNNGTNTSHNSILAGNGGSVYINLTGARPNTNVTVTLQNIFLSGISGSSFTQTVSYTTLPTPKTAAPRILYVSCINTSFSTGGVFNTDDDNNNVSVTVRNNDSKTATIIINNLYHGRLGAGARGTYSFYTGAIPYRYTVSVRATVYGKLNSDIVSSSGKITFCDLV